MKDSEAYRATTRKQIKEWHASISQRKNQEWLIVHVVRPDQSVAQGRIFQMKASVLDKVKADFNADKKDRSVIDQLCSVPVSSALFSTQVCPTCVVCREGQSGCMGGPCYQG